MKGEEVLIPQIRYFFYITNVTDMTCDEIVHQAHARCNEENLIGQLKSGVHALHAPVNTLVANWAYMVMAALAWLIKAWVALLLPISVRWEGRHQEERRRLLTMEFRTFLAAFVNVPCQIIKRGAANRVSIARLEPVAARLLPTTGRGIADHVALSVVLDAAGDNSPKNGAPDAALQTGDSVGGADAEIHVVTGRRQNRVRRVFADACLRSRYSEDIER